MQSGHQKWAEEEAAPLLNQGLQQGDRFKLLLERTLGGVQDQSRWMWEKAAQWGLADRAAWHFSRDR